MSRVGLAAAMVALASLGQGTRFEGGFTTSTSFSRAPKAARRAKRSAALDRLLTVRRPITSAPFHIPAWQQGTRRVRS